MESFRLQTEAAGSEETRGELEDALPWQLHQGSQRPTKQGPKNQDFGQLTHVSSWPGSVRSADKGMATLEGLLAVVDSFLPYLHRVWLPYEVWIPLYTTSMENAWSPKYLITHRPA